MNKKIRNDIILISSLVIVTAIAITFTLAFKKVDHLFAHIHVQNEVIKDIDLSKKYDETYYVKGINGEVVVHTKDGAIAIIQSNCPHQDCVHMGYVKETNKPIICAYNAVYITIDGDSNYDIEV